MCKDLVYFVVFPLINTHIKVNSFVMCILLYINYDYFFF